MALFSLVGIYISILVSSGLFITIRYYFSHTDLILIYDLKPCLFLVLG